MLLERNRIIEKTKVELNSYSKQLLLSKQEAEDIDYIYNKYFMVALKTKMISNIKIFLNELIKLATKHNSNGLKSYCDDLGKQISTFDTEKIDNLLNIFNENLQLKKLKY